MKLWSFALFMVFLCSGLLLAGDVQTAQPDEKQTLKQASREIRKGEFGQAEATLRRYLQINPSSTAAKLELSKVLMKQRRFQESRDISYEIAKADSKNARAFALLGYTVLSEGNFSDAARLLLNANMLDNDEPLAWAGAGLLDFYENRIDNGLEKLREAVLLEPDEPDFLFSLAQVASRAENYKESAAAYRKFLAMAPMKDTERRERIKGLIQFLEYLGDVSSLYNTKGSFAKIPVELVRQRPVLKVKIGNRDRDFNFVLDTGSGITVISQKTAAELNLRPIARGGNARAIGGSGKFEIVYGFMKSIGIGDVRISNVPVYIRKFHDDSQNIDGYIGLAVISRFLATIDYGEKTFALRKREDSELANFMKNEFLLPLRLTSSGFLSGEVMLEGLESPLNFIVDTGASISVISDELAGTSEFKRFITNEKMRVTGAAGILEGVPSLKLPKVSFGSISRESILAIALNLETINETSGFEQAGILGGNFLKDYRLTFDFKNSKIAFALSAENAGN